MRIKLRHRLTFSFDEPARNLIQVVRLMPRSHDGQRVSNWRIGVDPDCVLKAGEDHFGNLTHTLTVPGRTKRLELTIQGEITTYDVAGVVRGSAERLPIEIYCRSTMTTSPTATLRTFAQDITAGVSDQIAILHRLMEAIHEAIEPAADGDPNAAATFAARRGTAACVANLYVACARLLGFPARCVTGYRLAENGASQRHAWAEVHVAHLGWTGFDPVTDVSPQEFHIRTAAGLDATEAAGIRGTRLDGLDEALRVDWLVAPTRAAG